MSPLDSSSQNAWLAECLRRVLEVRAAATPPGRTDPEDALQELLRLPGDEPGWLHAAVAPAGSERRGSPLPALMAVPDTLLPVVTMRCALAAGLDTLQRLRAWRSTLGQAFDDVDTGMAVFGADGDREVTRNHRLDELLAQEPERARLEQLIRLQARQAGSEAENLREDGRELALAGGIYRLVSTRAAAGTLLPETAVLVLVDRESSALPTTQELRISFGLRGREPQIALLAAEGLSNAAIAQRLRLSAHTVRHYLERVLERLGLHSRKALALRLLAGERSRPADPSAP